MSSYLQSPQTTVGFGFWEGAEFVLLSADHLIDNLISGGTEGVGRGHGGRHGMMSCICCPWALLWDPGGIGNLTMLRL